MKLSRTRLLLVAVAAPIAMVAATTAPASATSGAAAVVTGSGTISPGLGTDLIGHTFDFGGTAVGAGLLCNTTAVGASIPIQADGTDVLGTVAEGFGEINVHANGCTWSGEYVRVGAAVVVALVNPVATAATGLCAFKPGSLTPPVQAYDVYCVAAIASSSQ